ncbi:MAG: acylphosphatase [Candidatus Aenigmarchaeota archaeon]|nr:acylphosphatase [Candidatus Aenigmarchaeota archaeon]
MLRCRIFIKGRVHGVGFRSYAKKNADELFLKGIVRNTRDGVEIVVEGYEPSIDEFVKRIREGPRLSYVDDVNVLKQNASASEFKDFNINS